MFFPPICQVTQHQPVPIHFVTKENVLLFFKMFWLVNRSFWQVWLLLGVCAIAKVILLRVKRRRRSSAGHVQAAPSADGWHDKEFLSGNEHSWRLAVKLCRSGMRDQIRCFRLKHFSGDSSSQHKQGAIMHAKRAVWDTIGVALWLCLCVGCVSTSNVRNEPRQAVRFESAVGAQVFYQAYIEKTYTRAMWEGPCVEIGLPLQPPYQHREFLTDNVYFNAAVRAADANHDGVISDGEARRYSDSIRPLLDGLVATAK